VKPYTEGRIAQSAVEGLVTEPLLTIEIAGQELLFVVDTDAIFSLIKPGICDAQVRASDVQARGVTGTQLDIRGEQLVAFTIRHKDQYMTFRHTFVVSPLKRCSSGILVWISCSKWEPNLPFTYHRPLLPPIDRLGIRGLKTPASGKRGYRETQDSQSRGGERGSCGGLGWYCRARRDCDGTPAFCENSPVSSR
jgi:hypothetical protein